MASSQPSRIFQHPTIGSIRCLTRDGDVLQFLGVQYATLRDRFSRGELLETYPQATILDASQHGPIAPLPDRALRAEQKIIQKALPDPGLTQSDTECLRLNIAVPSKSVEAGGLPVVLFLHGGGFFTSSSSWPHYDLAAFTALSGEIGRPVVAVSVE
jgi:carboxylesterase type B